MSQHSRQCLGKRRFRETLWFKKGAIASAQVEVAIELSSKGGDLELDLGVDSCLEERYIDDGTVSDSDRHEFGLLEQKRE